MTKPALTSLIILTLGALAYAGPESISSKDMKQTVAPEPTCPINWTGFYIGGHFGYGWGNGDTDITPLPSAAVFVNLAPTTLEPDPTGVFGGGQAGYNFQFGRFVAGAEADFSWSDLGGTDKLSPIIQADGTSYGGGTLTAREHTDWFGTARVRLGFTPTCRLLVYGTGGLAYGDVNYSANSDFRNPGSEIYPISFNQTKVGWTAGAGTEFALTRRWSVKVEYLYYDLGDESGTANPIPPIPSAPAAGVHYNWETTAHTVRAGLNFKF